MPASLLVRDRGDAKDSRALTVDHGDLVRELLPATSVIRQRARRTVGLPRGPDNPPAENGPSRRAVQVPGHAE
jgi:hypothetical protein